MSATKRGGRSRDGLESELAALRSVAAAPTAAESLDRLRAALQSRLSPVVTQAATLIAKHQVFNLQPELKAAFAWHLEEGVQRDPNCLAKAALLEALDLLECFDPAPFIAGAGYVQVEAAWPKAADTAAPVRSRSLAALARLGDEDALLYFAEGLADPFPSVRRAAAEAVGWNGQRAGAALLLLRLRLGDDEPEVLAACMSSLLAVAPEPGLRAVVGFMRGQRADATLAPIAALALGESRRPEAVPPLAQMLARAITPAERALAMTALATHRTEAAREILLGVIREGSLATARQAISALAVQRFDARVISEIRVAVGTREAELGAAVAEAFLEGDP